MTNLTRQEINAQAAAWLARLHSEDRSSADVAGFNTWVGEDALHRDAFEKLTMMWDAATEVEADPKPAVSRRMLVLGGGALAAAAAVGGVAILTSLGPERLETTLGEQRRLTLSDGSQLTLDTDTKVAVQMGNQRRSVELISGRANFVVAKDPMRPFIVTAGTRQVIAVGTAFDVARDGEQVSVMLVEGKVIVREPKALGGDRALLAGDRLRMGSATTGETQDRPDVSAATAWQSGRAVFDNSALGDAIAELNRYERRRLVITDPSVRALRISGNYRTGDSAAFARSIAELLPVRIIEQQDEILLSPKPSAN